MRTLIEDHMKQTKEKRQQHLDLNSPCEFWKGVDAKNVSTEARGALAYKLDTTIPKGMKIHLGHACNRGACYNTNHHYWATSQENVKDMVADKNGSWRNPYDRMVEKYGKEKANAMNSHPETAHRGGEANKGVPKKEKHKENIRKSITEWHKKRKQY